MNINQKSNHLTSAYHSQDFELLVKKFENPDSSDTISPNGFAIILTPLTLVKTILIGIVE